MNYIQLPSHAFALHLSALELLIYADAWTMQQNGKGYWKSNATIASQFNAHRSTVIRAINKLESRSLLRRVESENGRYLEALTPDPSSSVDATGSVHATGGSVDATGGVAPTQQSSSVDATQIENKRKPKREENRENVICPFQSEKFEMAWAEWNEYRRASRFKYKTVKSEQLALQKLYQESNGNEDIAIDAIATSIASGWRGLFASRTNGSRHNDRPRGKDITATDFEALVNRTYGINPK